MRKMAKRKPITPPAITAEAGKEREASVSRGHPTRPAKPGRDVYDEE